MSMKTAILATVGALGLATTAQAAIVYDTITVSDSSGNVIASVSATEAEITANPNEIFYVSGVAIDQTQFGNYGIVLNSGVAVDIFGISTGGPDGFDLAFGPGGQAASYAVQNPVVGTGLPINLTQYLDPSLQALGDTAFFTATGDVTIPNGTVPEPATWALMLVGFGMVGYAMRKRSKVTTTIAYA